MPDDEQPEPLVPHTVCWWLPETEFHRARRLWPDFDIDWKGRDFTAYCLQHEGFYRELAPIAERFQIACVTVDAYLEWCAAGEFAPWDRDHLTRYAVEACETLVDWPPEPGDPCWCGGGRSYAQCCGIPIRVTPMRGRYLAELLSELTQEPSWLRSRELLQAHPELLRNEVDVVLEQMRQAYADDEGAQALLEKLGKLLEECRAVGIERAYDQLLSWKAADPDQLPEELAAAVREAEETDRHVEETATEQALADRTAAWQRVAEATERLNRPPGERRGGWHALGWARLQNHALTHRFEELEAAADVLAGATESLRDDPPLRDRALREHATLFHLLRAAADTAESLDKVVQLLQTAVDNRPEQERVPYLDQLARALEDRYARWRSRSDLDRRIDAYRELVRAEEADPGGRAFHLDRLSMALHERALTRPNLHDVNEAVRLLEEAVNLHLPDAIETLALVSDLGTCHRLRYEWTGRTSDLNSAIAAHERVFAEGPPDGEEQGYALNNLGVAYLTRHRRTGDVADIRKAVDLLTRSVERTPAGHAVRAERLHNVASALVAEVVEEVYDPSEPESRQLAQLAAAFDAVRTFAAEVSATSPFRYFVPVWRSLLLAGRCRAGGDPADNDAAIAAGEEALGMLPSHYGERPRLVDTLAHSLLDRYRRLGSADDRERAAELFEFALAVPRAQWPGLPAQLRGLAHVLCESGETERATEIYRLAGGHPEQGDLRSRFAAACDWAVWAHRRGAGDEAAEALDQARATARMVARIWLVGGEEASYRFSPLERRAARTREVLADTGRAGAAPPADADAVCDLLRTASRGMPGPVPADLAEHYRGIAERLRHLERSSLDVTGSGRGKGALRAAWAELDRVLRDFPVTGLDPALACAVTSTRSQA
ncbi:hypothetical protein ACFU53_29670 [Streptomyces sp. NPDC057474]|uniref:hypothetical protein n=1 Tax=Streptomyces sp. NPDC057474 TaxID=3346144 RepID=UPI0036C67A00